MFHSLFAVVALMFVSNVEANGSALVLAKNSGCFACHSISKKVIGPAWKDVRDRYSSDPTARSALINKVKLGGKGKWLEETNGASMPPYWPRVRDDEVESLVDFILSL